MNERSEIGAPTTDSNHEPRCEYCGWKLDAAHASGCPIESAGGAPQRPDERTCATCDGEFIDHRHGALGHDWRPKPPASQPEIHGDYDPSPWCSGGHMTEASCTCGEIDSHD